MRDDRSVAFGGDCVMVPMDVGSFDFHAVERLSLIHIFLPFLVLMQCFILAGWAHEPPPGLYASCCASSTKLYTSRFLREYFLSLIHISAFASILRCLGIRARRLSAKR